VNDTVGNRLHARWVDKREHRRILDLLVLIDESELQARRAGVDD
jgi:hypothetical protein